MFEPNCALLYVTYITMDLLNKFGIETYLPKKLQILKDLRATVEKTASDFEQLSRTTFGDFATSLLVCAIPEDSNEEEECVQSDFTVTRDVATEGMHCSRLLLQLSPTLVDFAEATTPLATVCFVYLEQESAWSNSSSAKASAQLLTELSKGTSLVHLATAVLKSVHPKLRKDTWKKNLCYVYVYKAALFALDRQTISDTLPLVLPPGLLLVDDYSLPNQRLGVACMNRVVCSVTTVQLGWQGRRDVIFDALQRLLYAKDPDLIIGLHSCFRCLLLGDAVEGSFQFRDQNGVRKCEKIFSELLDAAESEQTILLRNAYSSQFVPYIECLGVNVIKYMNKTLRVVLQYVEVYSAGEEQTCRRNALLAVAAFVKYTWPRIAFHFWHIAESLFRMAYNLHPNTCGFKREIARCLFLLKTACPKHFVVFCTQLESLRDTPGVALLLACVNE